MKIVNDSDLIKSLNNFKQKPFDYCIIDNFFPTKISKELSNRFPKYSSKIWHTYKNKIENKKTCNNWNFFDDLTYRVFCYLNSDTKLPMIYMEDAVRSTLEIMQSPMENISIRTSYNIASMSLSPIEIASEIQKVYPDFKVEYCKDFRQNIADKWPNSINDQNARNDWNWKPKYDLSQMTKLMLENLEEIYK